VGLHASCTAFHAVWEQLSPSAQGAHLTGTYFQAPREIKQCCLAPSLLCILFATSKFQPQILVNHPLNCYSINWVDYCLLLRPIFGYSTASSYELNCSLSALFILRDKGLASDSDNFPVICALCSSVFCVFTNVDVYGC